MDSLELLASCIEQGRTTIAPALADASERKRLEQLQALGALVPARAQAIICPRCEARSVRVITAGSAFCIECGQVALALKDMQRLSPDGDWLRRRIAQALSLAGEPAWMMVPGRVWRIGDIGTSAQRRRVLFGQQLGDMMAQKVLLATWPTHVGETQAVIVTTSPTDGPGLPARRAGHPRPASRRVPPAWRRLGRRRGSLGRRPVADGPERDPAPTRAVLARLPGGDPAGRVRAHCADASAGSDHARLVGAGGCIDRP